MQWLDSICNKPNNNFSALEMTQMYTYALAHPSQAAQPVEPNTLGIEVTEHAIALTCGLGNIDPQHGPLAKADSPAAIEVCLNTPVPPAGTRLLTIRPDLDSIGAMALLSLRAANRPVTDDMRSRIAQIASLDRFQCGPWEGPRAIPETADDILADRVGPELGALAACASDHNINLDNRVATFITWLSNGFVPELYANAARERAIRLARSIRFGATQVEATANGRVATVISIEPGTLRLAYCLAPVVVALNPAFDFGSGEIGRKFTIARWAEGDADLDVVLQKISQREDGWGGQRGIKGSALGRPSRLSLQEVVAFVVSCLPNLDYQEAEP
jgi:hypothetical protein